MATFGTQDEDKQNKNTATMGKQTQITQIRHEPPYKQLEIKTNGPSIVCENTELRTYSHIIGQRKKLKR